MRVFQSIRRNFWLPLNLTVAVLGLTAVPAAVAAGTSVVFADLPTAPVEDNPLCYDAVSGALGNCPGTGTSTGIGRIAWVATEGGDYTSPVDAMTDLASWCGTPSAANHCLLRIAPGTYNVGASPLVMTENVDVEGAGRGTTVISGAVPGTGTIHTASDAVLRDLTVHGSGSPAVWNSYQTRGHLLRVGVTGDTVGVFSDESPFGPEIPGPAITLDDVQIDMQGSGTEVLRGVVLRPYTELAMRDTRISVRNGGTCWGVFQDADSGDDDDVFIFDSDISISDCSDGATGILISGMSAAFRILKNVEIRLTCSTTADCYGVHSFLGPFNQSVRTDGFEPHRGINLRIGIAEGYYGYGIRLSGSTDSHTKMQPVWNFTGLMINMASGQANFGIWSTEVDTRLNDAQILVKSSANSYGLWFANSRFTVGHSDITGKYAATDFNSQGSYQNSTLTGTNALTTYWFDGEPLSARERDVDNCRLSGIIDNYNGAITNVRNSTLIGAGELIVGNEALVFCRGIATDDSFYTTTCPP